MENTLLESPGWIESWAYSYFIFDVETSTCSDETAN
jgi:hypothetical protein